MARSGQMKKKGQAGAAKNYITRTQAIKKLQCTLSDFRRLCILKGIYPREPRSRKKANKGSSAPTSFYYAKDIQYLLHEPVLDKLREHKAFAKKLSRALGRGEWSLAKNLEESKPVYRIDHIVKERYPTFADSLRDLDDALSLLVLFATLPATPTIPASVIANCASLVAQWQLYVIKAKALRKVFLSIKGIYFQAEVHGETITWLVPYMFTQKIPSDLDYRIMLTFLELYQTLLGFVLFKLYTDMNLVYPPKLDEKLDDGAAGIGAHLLLEKGPDLTVTASAEQDPKEKKRVYAREVREKIKEIKEITGGDENVDASAKEEEEGASGVETTASASKAPLSGTDAQNEIDAFPAPVGTGADELPLATSSMKNTSLFSNYYFYISREVTRPTLEFVILSFSGRVGWDPTLGAGSPYSENDARITHHVVDRPSLSVPAGGHPGKRVYIQPQWVIDCVNSGTLLPSEEYGVGKVLPPHLSPFVDEEEVRTRGGYVPTLRDVAVERGPGEGEQDDDESDMSVVEEEDEVETTAKEKDQVKRKALLAAAKEPTNDALRHAAELEAEAVGVAPSAFDKEFESAVKAVAVKGKKTGKSVEEAERENELASIMLTGKKAKLYKKMAYSQQKRQQETEKLQKRKKAIERERKKAAALQKL